MNQNFGTVCIQRLAVVFSELAKNILGQNLKIQLKTSFGLNNLKSPKWEFKKKMLWDRPISHKDAKYSIFLLHNFFRVTLEF